MEPCFFQAKQNNISIDMVSYISYLLYPYRFSVTDPVKLSQLKKQDQKPYRNGDLLGQLFTVFQNCLLSCS